MKTILQQDTTDVVFQFEILSKHLEASSGIKSELFDAYKIYQELIEVRDKLAKLEASFKVAVV